MLTRTDQAKLQPLVAAKWIEYCADTATDPHDRVARDAWYRAGLHTVAGVYSTRDVDPHGDAFARLLEWFSPAGESAVEIPGWTAKQLHVLNRLAHKAWRAEVHAGRVEPFTAFMDRVIADDPDEIGTDGKRGFERVMGILAVMANDEAWIDRLAQAAERRIRWQLARFLEDLSWLEGTVYGWEYVQSIYTQARLWPTMDDAPAAELLKVLQMLDTHIRRLCRERGIRPCEIPRRSPAPPHQIVIVHEPPPESEPSDRVPF